MNELKCPFCGGEMIGSIGHSVCHYNPKCPIYDEFVPQEVLDKLETTRKALDVAVDALKRYEFSGSFNHYGEFKQDLKEMTEAHKALEQINEIKGGK